MTRIAGGDEGGRTAAATPADHALSGDERMTLQGPPLKSSLKWRTPSGPSEGLARCFEAQAVPGSTVELTSNAVAVSLADMPEARALREVLPDQAGGVFVGAAFPRGVRRSKVEVHPVQRFNTGVVMELGAVVQRDVRTVPLDRCAIGDVPSGVPAPRGSR
jgi:hypothetical protein